jgi:hypothetical protein
MGSITIRCDFTLKKQNDLMANNPLKFKEEVQKHIKSVDAINVNIQQKRNLFFLIMEMLS